MRHRATPGSGDATVDYQNRSGVLQTNLIGPLQQDPQHPSLHFKKIGRFWSARVGLHYRALAVEHDASVIWFWLGSHAEYDRLIQRE